MKFLRSVVGTVALFVMAAFFLSAYAVWLTGMMVGGLWLLITYLQSQPGELMSLVAVAGWLSACWGSWQVKERWLDHWLSDALTYGGSWAIELAEG